MAKKKYTVISRIDHNQVTYEPESLIELDDDEAETLSKAGAIGVAVEENKKVDPPKAPEDEAVRLAAIEAAIGKLNVDSAELWLKDGRPEAKAIEGITGWPVSAKDRDAVCEKLNAKK